LRKKISSRSILDDRERKEVKRRGKLEEGEVRGGQNCLLMLLSSIGNNSKLKH